MTRGIIVDAIQRAYPNITDSKERIFAFVDKMMLNDRVICESKGFAIYVKCNDEDIEAIRQKPGYILDIDNVTRLLKSTGDNVHIFALVSIDNKKDGKKDIFQGIKDLITKEKPKTISWYNKTMNKFHLRRILCQPQQ